MNIYIKKKELPSKSKVSTSLLLPVASALRLLVYCFISSLNYTPVNENRRHQWRWLKYKLWNQPWISENALYTSTSALEKNYKKYIYWSIRLQKVKSCYKLQTNNVVYTRIIIYILLNENQVKATATHVHLYCSTCVQIFNIYQLKNGIIFRGFLIHHQLL